MKVIYLISGLGYGGAETQLLRLALRLKARGCVVLVVSLTPPKAYVEELESAGIPVFSLDIRRKLPDPRPIFRIAKLIRSLQPEIVHSFMVHANLFSRLVRMLVPVPVLICSARSTDEGGRSRELLYRLTDPLCDLTTQVSQAGLERYIRVGVAPLYKIRYIPNGIDTVRFRPDPEARKRLREELQLGSAFVWLAVGRFDILKDYPNMLRAFSHLIQVHPNTLLIIAGDGLLRPVMEELVSDLGLKDRVSFLGFRRDISEVLNAADAYVISSACEGMPNVLLEAGATGLPIVATDVGGNREVVRDGETGFLVPPRDSEALALTMLHLMNLSGEERWRMGEAGRQYIKGNYSMDRVVDIWEALYHELTLRKGLRRNEDASIE